MGSYDFDFGGERKKKKRIRKKILGIVIFLGEIAAAAVLAYLLVFFGLLRTKVSGKAMEPTLAEDTTILVNRFAYFYKGPKRFDVVVFHQDEEEHSFYYTMRIIGLPGETIQIKDGTVWINGAKLSEPVRNLEKMHLAGFAEEPLTLEADEYFVLGDNRNKSIDSRFASIGTVTKGQIVGRAWITLEPFGIVSKLNLEKTEKKKK